MLIFVSLPVTDLRWGITKEEASGGKVISLCLNEVFVSKHFSRAYVTLSRRSTIVGRTLLECSGKDMDGHKVAVKGYLTSYYRKAWLRRFKIIRGYRITLTGGNVA